MRKIPRRHAGRTADQAEDTTVAVQTSSGGVGVVEFRPKEVSIHAQIRADRDRIHTGETSVQVYRDYARGRHKAVLTPGQERILRNLLGNKFCDNVCDQVLTSSNARLSLVRFTSQDKETKKWLDDWMVSAKLRAQSRDVHYNALRDGNHIVALDWDNDEQSVCMYLEDWWDGNEGVFIAYDAKKEPVYAVKEWIVVTIAEGGISQTQRRRNVWFEDRLERYEGNGTEDWNKVSLPEDNGQWPVPWLDKKGKPLGIPYVHFPNSGKGKRIYGISDIDNVLGFQDQLNDLQYAISAAARLTAYQTFFAKGVASTDPETGKPVKYEMSPAKIFTNPKPDSDMKALPAGDLGQLIATYKLKEQTVAIRSRTPIYDITGEGLPSGEALFQAQQPAIAKASENVEKWQPKWTEVAVMAIKIHNRFSTDPEVNVDIKTAMVTAVMAPPDRRDKLTMSVVVMNLKGVISNKESLRLLGYNEDEVDSIMEEIREEMMTSQMDAMAAFNAGSVPGAGGVPPNGSGGSSSGGKPPKAAGGIGPPQPKVGAGAPPKPGSPVVPKPQP